LDGGEFKLQRKVAQSAITIRRATAKNTEGSITGQQQKLLVPRAGICRATMNGTSLWISQVAIKLLERNSRREAAGTITKVNPAMARTFTDFRLCRAATALQMAISSMSAASAAGGVLRSSMPTPPTSRSCATDERVPIGTSSRRTTSCLVFVAFKTERVVLAKQFSILLLCQQSANTKTRFSLLCSKT